jgi:diguanylate cyclase (GGDEF)-like protein
MAVEQAAMPQERAGDSRGIGWLAQRPLLTQPARLVAYLTAVVVYDLALIGWELATTPVRSDDLLLFGSLVACGAACVEATRRLGMSAGVSRDLLAAWWLPIAVLLPPLYALIAPIPLSLLLQLRVRRAPLYVRVFGAAALGVAGAAASLVSGHFGLRVGTVHGLTAWFSYPGSHHWFTRPLTVVIAVGCAALFSLLNAALVAVAVRAAGPLGRRRTALRDSESLIIDVTEVCAGVLITIACMLSPVLLFVALPPIILLQRSLLHQQLRAAARTDAKTGLLNAAAWQREADTEITRAMRAGKPLALLVIDIDHFKRVNDTHGHLAGDQVLMGVAEVLRQTVRDADVVGRFGGEEFVVLLPGADAAEACKIAERLRQEMSAREIVFAAGQVRVTVSVGAAVIHLHGNDLPSLLASADLAMYLAKQGGRNQVRLFDQGSQHGAASQAMMVRPRDPESGDGPEPAESVANPGPELYRYMP